MRRLSLLNLLLRGWGVIEMALHGCHNPQRREMERRGEERPLTKRTGMVVGKEQITETAVKQIRAPQTSTRVKKPKLEHGEVPPSSSPPVNGRDLVPPPGVHGVTTMEPIQPITGRGTERVTHPVIPMPSPNAGLQSSALLPYTQIGEGGTTMCRRRPRVLTTEEISR